VTYSLFHRPFTRAVRVGSDATWAVTRLAVRSSLVVPRYAAGALSRRLVPEPEETAVLLRRPGRGGTLHAVREREVVSVRGRLLVGLPIPLDAVPRSRGVLPKLVGGLRAIEAGGIL